MTGIPKKSSEFNIQLPELLGHLFMAGVVGAVVYFLRLWSGMELWSEAHWAIKIFRVVMMGEVVQLIGMVSMKWLIIPLLRRRKQNRSS